MDIRLLNARISFANGLWVKSVAVAGGTPKHNCDYIVTDDTKVQYRNAGGAWVDTNLVEVQRLVALDAFKGDAKKATAWFDKLDSRQKSVRDGDKNTDKSGDVRDGYEGNWYVHATSSTHMPVLRGDRTEVHTAEESPVYSGCYVNARVSLYANMKAGQQGMFASLQGTQFSKAGDSFGGGAKASADDFDDVAEGADAGDFA